MAEAEDGTSFDLWSLHEDQIKPKDSVSQSGYSKVSRSTTSKVAARKAALIARAAGLKKSQELQRKQLELEQQQETLKIQTEIAAAEAEEQVYSCETQNIDNENEVEVGMMDRITIKPNTKEPEDNTTTSETKLNPEVKAWTNTNNSHIGNFQYEMMHMMHLPKTELIKFDGNPLKYWSFIRSFDNSIGDTPISDNAKLNRLLQYCTGNALEVIECCVVMEPELGYTEARRLLLQRFGNQFTIAKAWIDKVTKGPNLRSGNSTELRKYADSVRSCVVSLTAMGRLSEIDNELRMKKIVEKLPLYLQGGWRKVAVQFLKSNGRYPGIEKLAEFIETAAEELDDPVFGVHDQQSKESQERTLQQKSGFRKSSAVNFNVQTNGDHIKREINHGKPVRECRCCRGGHLLYRCERFKQMSLGKRREFVMENRLCFNCFSSTHASYNCSKGSMCNVSGCSRKHSSLLHDDARSSVKSVNSNLLTNNTRSSCTQTDSSTKALHMNTSACGVIGAGRTRIALPIVPVVVKSDTCQESFTTFALLDPGSTNTFCSQDMADKLKLKGENTTLSLNTLTNERHESHSKMTSLTVADVSGRHVISMSNVFVIPQMPVLKDNFVMQRDIDCWNHLKDIELPVIDLMDGNVSLLIGQDNPLALVPLDVRTGKHNEPYATQTVFGWTINGPLHQGTQQKMVANFVQVDNSLESLVRQFWEWDTVVDDSPQLSFDDKYVLELWNKSVIKDSGHYKLPIPFKQSSQSLPNNYSAAKLRLESLGRKLSKDETMFEKYKDGIHDLVDKGYAEKVCEDEETNEGMTWYLPHHAVITEKKPGKFRIVYDCAAKYGGTCLNSEVYQGPDLTNTLIGVLLRFRQDRIAISGDIESMFHQVKVAEQHRDVLRFLWWKNDDIKLEPEVYRMTSHLFGGVWSPSAANYSLRKTADDNKDSFDGEVVRTVYKDFYVDDLLKSVPLEQQAIDLVKGISELLQKGGFKIKKWLSNSRNVLESIPKEDWSKNLKDIDLVNNQLPQEKALGVSWNTEYDELVFKHTPKNKPDTKRGLISVISSLYDPLGFLCPLILKAKTIFQDECKLKKDWDSPLEPINAENWSKWKSNLFLIENFSIPRCVVPDNFQEVKSCELHNFADASMTGYGAASYLRLVNLRGEIHCSFLIGKARLAPIKTLTIPRLELCAAVLSAKLDHMLRKELTLHINSSTFWTDSTIVLHYIKNESQRYQTFVANRVSQIRELTSADSWRHVESAQNPADCASRGLSAEQMISNELWINGPNFIWQKMEDWPEPRHPFEINNDELELRKVKVNLVEAENLETCTNRLMKRYSSWHKLKKAVAMILRLKSCLLERSKGDNSCVSVELLTVNELRRAEFEIIKYVQSCAFSTEMVCISQGKEVSPSSKIRNLDPMMNADGILCVGGRLGNAALPEQSKHQMIMPKSHHVVTLIVRSLHEELGHSGKEHVLAEIRQKYWIISARRAVKSVLNQCFTCKRIRGKQYTQKMADLPQDRVTAGKAPFTNVGVDCFGPFVIKRGRSQVKRYGCLFTCLCTRAIHIEKLDTMDTDSFILALRRFESRRGRPEILRSDNGTNFKGAQRELRDAIRLWNKDQIHEYMLQKEIQWIFNTPTASHMGGVWERQIRTVRKVLNSLGGQKGLKDEGLNTLFCEVEAIVNSRPITVVSDNPDDMEALTPNHILMLRSGFSLPPGQFCIQDCYKREWKHVQFLANQFWKRWLREYLPSLQMRQKWHKTTGNLAKGDIVTLVDEQSPRNMWSLGRIVRTIPGKDGLVRTVEVKTKGTVLTRPVNKLCLLEAVNV